MRNLTLFLALVLAPGLFGQATTVWVGGPASSGGGATSLTGLSDVTAKRGNSTTVQMTTGAVSTDDYAKFDANGNLVSAGPGGSGGGALDDLTDVTAPTPASGDGLHHNGTAWVNTALFTAGTTDLLAARMAANWGTAGTTACATSNGVMFDSGSAVGCDANFTWDGSNLRLGTGDNTVEYKKTGLVFIRTAGATSNGSFLTSSDGLVFSAGYNNATYFQLDSKPSGGSPKSIQLASDWLISWGDSTAGVGGTSGLRRGDAGSGWVAISNGTLTGRGRLEAAGGNFKDTTPTTGDTLVQFDGGAGETGNLVEFRNNAGTVNAAVTAAGVVAGVSAVFGPVATSRIAGSAGFYADMPEITPSGNPAADHLRLYVADDGGVSKLYYRNSAGSDTEITAGGGLTADSVGTNELNDGGNSPIVGGCVTVASGGADFDYDNCLISGDPGVVTPTDQQTLEAKTLTDPSLGDDSALSRRVVNDTGSGTSNGDLAEIQDDGANAEEAITAGTGDTNKHVYPVRTGGGTSGNAELAVLGEVQIDMDGACSVGDNVILSTSVAGEGSCTSSPLAQNVHCVGVATQTTGAAGLADVDLSADCSRVAEGAGETRSFSWAITDPATGDSEALQWFAYRAVTITAINCSTDTGTADIQLDERALTTPNTGGTDVMSGALQCDSDNAQQTSFSNAGIAAGALANLDIDAVASAPTQLRIHVTYTVN